MSDYHDKMFKKGLQCKHCGKPIDDRNKTGSCAHCRMTIDQRGAGNHMFGKVMTEEERKRCADSTRKLWENPEYREKVIANATGLHRSEKFKRGQSMRTKASYDKIEGLRDLRGKISSQSWRDGNTHYVAKPSHVSKEEKELQSSIESFGIQVVRDATIQIGKRKYISPDMLIDGKIIVEYYGDYYHGNPDIYSEDDIICYGAMTAKEKQEGDKKRVLMARRTGYKVIVVWENDYKNNKEKTTAKVINQIQRYRNEMV